jgi:F0F1-type ATP synthase gamma subunit
MLSEDHKKTMSLNTQPKEILPLKGSEVIAQYRKLHSEELQGLYFSPDSVTVIKSLRTRYVRYVVSTGAMEKYTYCRYKNLLERNNVADPHVHRGIVLRWIL